MSIGLLMPAFAPSRFARAIGLAMLGLLAGTLAIAAVWHFASSRYGLADLTREIPSWVAVSMVIFMAAVVSSTVGFALALK